MRQAIVLFLLACGTSIRAQSPDWPAANAELLAHYQAILRIDTTDPPGNETRARLRGNGAKRPIGKAGRCASVRFALAQTAEKIPRGTRLVATDPPGHGSRPWGPPLFPTKTCRPFTTSCAKSSMTRA